jgi:hypothetical protein
MGPTGHSHPWADEAGRAKSEREGGARGARAWSNSKYSPWRWPKSFSRAVVTQRRERTEREAEEGWARAHFRQLMEYVQALATVK